MDGNTHPSLGHIDRDHASTNNTGLTDLLIAIYEHGDVDTSSENSHAIQEAPLEDHQMDGNTHPSLGHIDEDHASTNNTGLTDLLNAVDELNGSPNRTETSADVCVDASFENGNEIQEDSLDDADVGEDNEDVVDRVVEYKIVEGSTQRQRSKLVDSNGYSYVLKLKRTGVTYWRCCVRNAVMKCPATVVQKGGDAYIHTHIHRPTCMHE
ncbi:uncharacterized protein LOC117103025 [Anneissia japonica]|uniref:uncharacterized protein LOC117103025 n=1 Tax=Anneissia japonica TaxID=1529436 RepID=UPI001425AD6B|nr:uncharacterized protein LOC117103025 [Anneissia japonica]